MEVSVDGDSGQLTVTGVVDEARLYGSKLRLTSVTSTKVGQPGITITDTVTSLSGEASELELLYHVNFGPPLVGPGAKVLLPSRKVAPRDTASAADVPRWNVYAPPTAGLREIVFFADLACGRDGRTQALLCNAAGDRGVSLHFNKEQLPCFSLWKNCQAEIDGYVTGLEPGSNFPNAKPFERDRGRVIALAAGQSRTFELSLEVHPDRAAVAAAAEAIAALQAGIVPEILPKPDPLWSEA